MSSDDRSFPLLANEDEEVTALRAENQALKAEVERLQEEMSVKQARLWAISTTLQAKGNLGDDSLFNFAARLEAYVRGSHEADVKSRVPMVSDE